MVVNIFQFLEKTKGKKIPLKYKLLHNIPLTEDDLIYNGNLLLFRSKITYLPDNLTVNGILYLENYNIKSLPNNLTVNSYLFINYTNISTLPEDLYVAGDLFSRRTPLGYKIKNDKSLLNKYSKQIKGKIFYE